MPADDGLGLYEQDGVPQAPKAAGQCTEEPPIKSAPPRSFDLAADDDELLAKDQVLGDQGCPRRDEGQDDVEQEAKEGDHDSERLPRRPVPDRKQISRRDGHVTVGKTGSDSAHVRSICAPQGLAALPATTTPTLFSRFERAPCLIVDVYLQCHRADRFCGWEREFHTLQGKTYSARCRNRGRIVVDVR